LKFSSKKLHGLSSFFSQIIFWGAIWHSFAKDKQPWCIYIDGVMGMIG